MKRDDTDTIAWIIGVLLLATGSAFQWGWPSALIAAGAIFSIWPLAKNFAR